MASRGKEGNGLYGGSNIKKTKETNSVLKDRLVTAHQRLKDLSHAPNNLLVGTTRFAHNRDVARHAQKPRIRPIPGSPITGMLRGARRAARAKTKDPPNTRFARNLDVARRAAHGALKNPRSAQYPVRP